MGNSQQREAVHATRHAVMLDLVEWPCALHSSSCIRSLIRMRVVGGE